LGSASAFALPHRRRQFALNAEEGIAALRVSLAGDGADRFHPSSGAFLEITEEMWSLARALSGAEVNWVLQVDGALVETDAEHVQQSTITLVRLDFGRLVEQKAVLQALDEKKPGAGIDELRVDLNKIDGFRLNRPTFDVRFR
jgi:hypothetical protein